MASTISARDPFTSSANRSIGRGFTTLRRSSMKRLSDSSSRSMVPRIDIDAESRMSIRGTIERELESLKRFMEDLRNVVKPRPIERFALEVNGSLAEIVDAMRAEGERVSVAVEATYAAQPLVIQGDRFALGR